MLLEYLVAAVVGVAGMLSVLHMAGNVATFENRILQQTAAQAVLRELAVLQRFAAYGPAEFQAVCESPSAHTLEPICRSTDRWLLQLPEHHIAKHPDGVIELSWQLADGVRATLTAAPHESNVPDEHRTQFALARRDVIH